MQARLSGAQRITLKVGGDSDGLINILKRVEGVNRVVPNLNGGVEFENIPGQDPRPAVARAVVEAGYDLLEIRPIGLSLEEIFLQLTRDEPEPPTTVDYEMIDEQASVYEVDDDQNFDDQEFDE